MGLRKNQAFLFAFPSREKGPLGHALLGFR